MGKRLSEEYHFLFYSSCPGTDNNADDADDGDDDNDDDDDDDDDGGGCGDNRDFKIRQRLNMLLHMIKTTWLFIFAA